MKTNKKIKDKKPKYLVRTRDNHIWELDKRNVFYKSYSCKPMIYSDGTEILASPSMNYEDLTKIYGFIPIKKDQLEIYEKKHQEYLDFTCWQTRSDGHGGIKGGTFGEWIEYKELNKRIKYSLSKNKNIK